MLLIVLHHSVGCHDAYDGCYPVNDSFSLLFVVQDPVEPSIAMSNDELISVVSAASLALLRRDMSLNRRFYAWILGTC